MTESRASAKQAGDPPEVARAHDRWAASYDADRNATRDLGAEVVRRAPLAVAGRGNKNVRSHGRSGGMLRRADHDKSGCA